MALQHLTEARNEILILRPLIYDVVDDLGAHDEPQLGKVVDSLLSVHIPSHKDFEVCSLEVGEDIELLEEGIKDSIHL